MASDNVTDTLELCNFVTTAKYNDWKNPSDIFFLTLSRSSSAGQLQVLPHKGKL